MPSWLRRLLDGYARARPHLPITVVTGQGRALLSSGGSARACWRLMTCVAGDADHLIERHGRIELARLPPGHVLLVAPGCGIAMGGRAARMLNLLLDERGVAFHLHHRAAGVAGVMRGRSISLHRVERETPELPALCRMLALALRRRGSDAYLRALFSTCWALAEDLARSTSAQSPGGGSSFRAACAAIAESLPKELGRDQLAAAIGVHPNHLSRLFRQHAGMGVGEYVLRQRLRLAFDLLDASERPIGEVARSAGFSSHAVFTQACRRIHGSPPSRLRGGGAARAGMR